MRYLQGNGLKSFQEIIMQESTPPDVAENPIDWWAALLTIRRAQPIFNNFYSPHQLKTIGSIPSIVEIVEK
jgi:hypothetical protein